MDKLQQGYINLKRAKDELKKHRKMILDACMQDREYREKFENVLELRKALKIRRDSIIDPAEIEKLENLMEQVRLEKSSLNEWIVEYVRDTKMTSVNIQDSLFEIVPSYQLISKA